MDFDSLKITAKINSSNYEGKNYDTATHAKVSNVSKANNVKAVTATNSDNNASNDNSNSELDRETFLSQLSSTINVANENLKAMMVKKEFSYRVHEETHRVIVDVKNSETGEVIKEIPSESDLDTLAKIQELAGIFVDEKR